MSSFKSFTTMFMSKKRYCPNSHKLIGAIAIASSMFCSFAHADSASYSYDYDEFGNVKYKSTSHGGYGYYLTYDVLGRAKSKLLIWDDIPVNYEYNGQNQLIRVAEGTDSFGLRGTYTYDGLGNQLSATLPETGTSTFSYDIAGNLLSKTDAKGQVTNYSYDALNRLKRISYSDGNAINYTYDQGANAKGRVSQISDQNGSIQYTYDVYGRILSDTRSVAVNSSTVTGTILYQYDSAGRLSSQTYPNGRRVSYTRDALGHISQIDTSKDGVTNTVLSQVAYRPFEGMQSYRNSAGQTYTRNFDTSGRVVNFTLNNQVQAINYNPAGQIVGIGEIGNAARQATFGYDQFNQLISYVTPQTTQNFTNMLKGEYIYKDVDGVRTTYNSGVKRQLTQVAGSKTSNIISDANGSITDNSDAQFSYDARGRMNSVTNSAGVVQYVVNALGQRAQKTVLDKSANVLSRTTYYYDKNGKLINERTGAFDVDYIYLENTPVAVIK
ncbi:RHS repeat protein [Undibacterium sp. CY18W]|uniref:RHS repeat protein n=1 Tax=Undibacterium hunanense TaxID=2762292 RepID=A0ABR6ZJD7_9BURK|nr:RHS repeat protein [Undibacterium hunanense]MBC3915988.1 RHS repeat protein [Undibacterium hunanense]